MHIHFCSLQRIGLLVQLGWAGLGDDERNKKANKKSSSSIILRADRPVISFASSWKSWAAWSQASWAPASGVWGVFSWHLENRFPDRVFYWFDIQIKFTQIWNSKWRKVHPATTTETMWNLQPGICWRGLPSHLPFPPAHSPQSQGNVVHIHTHTEPVLLGSLQFAFESDHPLQFSAAVHVKTALNSSRNCWHTSVDVSPSTLCSIPRGRSEVLPPLHPWEPPGKSWWLCTHPTSTPAAVGRCTSCQFSYKCSITHAHLRTLLAEQDRDLPLIMNLLRCLWCLTLK